MANTENSPALIERDFGDPLANEHKCLYCGRFIAYAGTGRPPLFCSQAHKSAYHRGESSGRPVIEKECGWCGRQFTGTARAKYHSAACRQAAYENRRRQSTGGTK